MQKNTKTPKWVSRVLDGFLAIFFGLKTSNAVIPKNSGSYYIYWSWRPPKGSARLKEYHRQKFRSKRNIFRIFSQGAPGATFRPQFCKDDLKCRHSKKYYVVIHYWLMTRFKALAMIRRLTRLKKIGKSVENALKWCHLTSFWTRYTNESQLFF